LKKIERLGNTPRPIQLLFGGSIASNAKLWEKYGKPEIWECTSMEEIGKNAHLDSCEMQILIDKKNNRYYLVAMTIDGERVRAKIDEDETGLILVEDTGKKPTTVVYFMEVTKAHFDRWAEEDRKRRSINTVTGEERI
jgi:hypothetical protein